MADNVRKAVESSKLEGDIKSLREDVEKLRSDLRSDFDAVRNDLSELTRDITSEVASRGRQVVETVEHQVEEKPIPSTLVAFGAGLLTAFLLSRLGQD